VEPVLLLPHDLILKPEGKEFVLYEFIDRATPLRRVDGPWPDEATAKREAIAKWIRRGDVYLETGQDIYTLISD
jgi:hypothetical protein